MTPAQQRLDDLITTFLASRGDRIGFDDVAALLNALLQQHVADYCTTRSRAGATIDEINSELAGRVMPMMLKWRSEQLARFAAFMNDPSAPSHAVN